jgi:hypothetical protein
MNALRLISTFIILIDLFVLPARAQQYTRKESELVMAGPLHDIIPCPGGGHLVITYPLVETNSPADLAITKYDAQLSILYNNPLKELHPSYYRGALYSDNRLFLFCSNNSVVTRYEIDDKTGKIIGKPLTLYTLVEKEFTSHTFSLQTTKANFYTGSSHNKEFHYSFARNVEHKKQETIEGVILNKKMEVTAHFSFLKPKEEGEWYHNKDDAVQVVLSDKGALTIVYRVAVEPKRHEYIPNKYTLVQVDEKGTSGETVLSDLPVGDLRDFSLAIQDDQLTFTGLLSHTSKEGFTAFVSGRFDPVSKKITDLRETALNTLLSNLPPFMVKAIGKNGISTDSRLIRSIPLKDGSKIIIAQPSTWGFVHEGYYGGVLTPDYNTGGPIQWFYRSDITVLKMDPHNVPLWLDVITNTQAESDLTIDLGIASTLDDKDNLHLFFNDKTKNQVPCDPRVFDGTNTILNTNDYKSHELVCVSITPDGKMKKQFIGENKDYPFHLMPENSLSGIGNTLYFMAIKFSIALHANHLLNHADYRFGSISIKD